MLKIKNKKIKFIILALFVTFALSLSMDLVDFERYNIDENINWIAKGIVIIERYMNLDIFKSVAIFGVVYLLLIKRDSSKKERNIFKVILAILFSLFTILGYSYAKINSWNLIFMDQFQLFKSIIIFFGYYIIYKLIIDYLFDYAISKIKTKTSDNQMFKYIFEKHSFIIPFIILLVCWLPYLICYFPGVLSPDSNNQIKQYFGLDVDERSATASTKLIDENVKITNHHPVTHTIILGTCVQIGKMFGSDSFGIFIYTIIQTSLLAGALAYIINYMKKLKTNKWVRIITLMIFAIMPVFPFYAVEITKDVPFVCFLIFYIGELYNLIQKAQHAKISMKKFFSIIVLSLLVCLFRNNGVYVVLLSLPFVAIINKVDRKKILIATLIIFLVYQAFIKFLLPVVFKIPNGGIREMLSIPFQQTARYVKEYEEDVTEEEKEIIDKVLEYDTLSTRYNPIHADAVKNKYSKEATSDDLKKYFEVWFKQFFKHPNVYVESFINNYYGYFYLQGTIKEYVVGCTIEANEDLKNTGQFEYEYNDFVDGRHVINELIELSKKMPIVSLITNIALNNWIILGMVVYLLYKKKYKYIVILLPSLANILVCFASPVNTCFRYALPIIFTMPLMISIFLNIVNKQTEVEIVNEKEDSGTDTML